MSKAISLSAAIWLLGGVHLLYAQQAPPQAEVAPVPRLIRIANVFHPANGLAAAPVESVTLSLYREEQGGAPLWQETQNVSVDSEGRYTAMMGATLAEGVPLDLFRSGEPRWLGVQFNRPAEMEQPRVLLVSVPYALKSADADTLGGRPASAYLLNPNAAGAASAEASSGDPAPAAATAKAFKPRAENGTANYIARFTDATDVGNSVLYQSGSNIGLGTTSPTAPLTFADVLGNRFQLYTGNGTTNRWGMGIQNWAFVMYMDGGSPGVGKFSWRITPASGDASAGTEVVNLYTSGNLDLVNPSNGILRAFGSGNNYFAGNIGIGTAAPASKLVVAGQAAIGAGGSTQSFGNDLYINSGNPSVFLDGYNNPSSASVTFQTRGASTFAQTLSLNSSGVFSVAPGYVGATGALTVNQNGNVGIGTATPGARLEVDGTLKLGAGSNGIVFPDGTQQMTAAVSGSGGSSGLNPHALAILRWYPANLITQFTTGAAPAGVAFDGANMWIANGTDNTVTKLQTPNGNPLGTFSVGTNPHGVAFDGASIWVANYGSGNVTKLRASDGSLLGTFSAAGTNPCALAFDGANIWVANYGTGNLTKLRASDGSNLGNFAVGANPCGVAFDGTNLWVANSGSGTVTKLLASNGSVQGTFTVGTSPRSVTYDGVNVWITNYGSNNVTKLLASNGSVQGTFATGTNPAGAVFDGTYIWVANSADNTVSKLLASNGSVQGTFPVGLAPNSAAFDGANIWITNSSSNTVNKL